MGAAAQASASEGARRGRLGSKNEELAGCLLEARETLDRVGAVRGLCGMESRLARLIVTQDPSTTTTTTRSNTNPRPLQRGSSLLV